MSTDALRKPEFPPHSERHFTASEVVRDIVIGMSDGLTVPFALAAGLSGAVGTTNLIVVAGLAEIAAGTIAMGLGGFLAGRTDAEHYESERRREQREVVELEQREVDETVEILGAYGLDEQALGPVIAHFKADHEAWVDFMMRFELGLERPQPRRALQSAITIGSAYAIGGLIPLLPYMLTDSVGRALPISAVMTLSALLVFGYIKGRFTGLSPLKGALQTVLVGGIAAAVAYWVAKVIS